MIIEEKSNEQRSFTACTLSGMTEREKLSGLSQRDVLKPIIR